MVGLAGMWAIAQVPPAVGAGLALEAAKVWLEERRKKREEKLRRKQEKKEEYRQKKLLKAMSTSDSEGSDFGISAFILVALLVHFYDATRRMWTFSFPLFEPVLFVGYIILAVLATIIGPLRADASDYPKTLAKALGLSAFAYFIPVFVTWFLDLEQFIGVGVAFLPWLIMLASPIWFWYTVWPMQRTSIFARFLCTSYILVWIFIIIFLAFGTGAITLEQIQISGAPRQALVHGWDQVKYGVEKFSDAVWISYNQTQNIVLGRVKGAIDPYAAKTDEQSKRKLGISLSQLKPEPTQIFLEGFEVNVRSDLTADVIDTEINISIICESDERNKNMILEAKEIFPYNKYTIEQPMTESITCTFDPEFTPGIHEVHMRALIDNFKTLSYVRTFMMNQESLRALQKQGKNPLQVYKISPSELISTYTRGPLRLALKAGESPVPVDPSLKSVKLNFDISLENRWEGSITRINRLVLIVPKPFEVTGITSLSLPPGPERIARIYCAELNEDETQLCDDSLENVYTFTPEAIEALPKNIKQEPILIRAKLESDGSENILQDQPFTNKYFKATVEYNYETRKSAKITVKEAAAE